MNRTKYLKGECSECGGHVEFPAEAAGTTIDCPHCGKPTELLLAAPPEEPSVPRMTIVWTLVAVLVLALGLAGALAALNRAQKWATRQKQQAATRGPAPRSVDAETAVVTQPRNPLAGAGFDVSAIALEKTPGSSLVYAIGTLNNLTDRQRFGVKVELDLLDDSGQKVGAATDYQQVLEPKGEWHFKALVVDSKAATAKLASVKEDQ